MMTESVNNYRAIDLFLIEASKSEIAGLLSHAAKLLEEGSDPFQLTKTGIEHVISNECVLQLTRIALDPCDYFCCFNHFIDSSITECVMNNNTTSHNSMQTISNTMKWCVAFYLLQCDWSSHREKCPTCTGFPQSILDFVKILDMPSERGDPVVPFYTQAITRFDLNNPISWHNYFFIQHPEIIMTQRRSTEPSLSHTSSCSFLPMFLFQQQTLHHYDGSESTSSLQNVPLSPFIDNGSEGSFSLPFLAQPLTHESHLGNESPPDELMSFVDHSEEDDDQVDQAGSDWLQEMMKRTSENDPEVPPHLESSEPSEARRDNDNEVITGSPPEPEFHHGKVGSDKPHRKSRCTKAEDKKGTEGALKRSWSPFLPKEVFFRKKLCSYYYYTGKCSKGDLCNFSHDIREGMKPPTRLNEIGTSRPSPTGYVPIDKLKGTKPCKWFVERGWCRKGDSCTFSHDPQFLSPELRAKMEKPQKNGTNSFSFKGT